MANSSTNAKKVGSGVKILQLRHRSPPRTISSLHIGTQYVVYWDGTSVGNVQDLYLKEDIWGGWGWGLYKKDIDNVEYWEPEVGIVDR